MPRADSTSGVTPCVTCSSQVIPVAKTFSFAVKTAGLELFMVDCCYESIQVQEETFQGLIVGDSSWLSFAFSVVHLKRTIAKAEHQL